MRKEFSSKNIIVSHFASLPTRWLQFVNLWIYRLRQRKEIMNGLLGRLDDINVLVSIYLPTNTMVVSPDVLVRIKSEFVKAQQHTKVDLQTATNTASVPVKDLGSIDFNDGLD